MQYRVFETTATDAAGETHACAASSKAKGLDDIGCLSRRELFAWVAGCLAMQALVLSNFYSISGGDAATGSLAAKSIFQLIAWYAVFQLLYESTTELRATPRDVAVALLACCAALVLWRPLVSGAALTLVGFYLWATNARDDKLKAAAVVSVAIAVNMHWAPKLFEIVSLPLLRADAALVATLLSLSVPDVHWSDTIITSSGHSIGIYGACSSFHNISLGVLCWITVTKLIRSYWIASDLMFALAVVSAVVILNTARLALIARGQAEFAFWHDDLGAEIFAWVTTLVVVALSLWGATRKTLPS